MSTYMTNHRTPAAYVEEAEAHFLLSLEIPGIPKDRTRIEITDDILSVSGEGRLGPFSRSFSLPPGVDATRIEAHSEDGVLQLYVPKTEQAKPRQIQISQGTASSGFFAKVA